MSSNPDILCIGAVLWDVIGRGHRDMAKGTDIAGRIKQIPGGVALNIAIALARHGLSPAVLSAVGRDAQGDALIARATELGIDCGYLTRREDLPTDVYMAIEDPNGLVAAVADAHSLEACGDAILAPLSAALYGWDGPVVLDGNLTVELLDQLIDDPRLRDADLRLVPASPGKAERLSGLIHAGRGVFYGNLAEACVLTGTDCTDASMAAEALIAIGARRAIITDGGNFVADAAQGAPTLTATPPTVPIIRVTGAGDCFLAAHIVTERQGANRQTSLNAAVQAAAAHVSGKDIL